MTPLKNLSEEIAKQFRLLDHLVGREARSATATEIREMQKEAKERRKRTMPFARRFVVETASAYGLDLAVYVGWYDGDFMYDGRYIPTIGLDGVDE